MRDLPDGIQTRRVRGADRTAVVEFVLTAIDAYREWAPHWTPVPPSPEMRARLDGLYDDDERAWALMALAADEIIGLVSLAVTTGADARVPDPGTVYLWHMFVRPDWQGSGLAGALMDRVFEEARRRGYARMVLWTPAGAKQARRFYEREGWELTGEEDPESKFGLPLVQYGRDLS
jgi:GNAT superfamily N-acetyltransferase